MSGKETLDVREIQAAAWKNKLVKGFNTTNVPLEFCYLQREAGEAFDAWRKGLGDVDEELADVVLFAVSLAEMLGIDLQSAIERKMTKNAARAYVLGANGFAVRAEQQPASTENP